MIPTMTEKRRYRYFNTTGPCRPHMHYMLPPADRLVGASLDRYINDELYWVLHAPRQTGKTTFLQSWMRELNASGDKYGEAGVISCYVSVERCQGISSAEEAIPGIVQAVEQWSVRNEVPIAPLPDEEWKSLLNRQLSLWAEQVAPKKLVILFDEVDILEGPALISFLRQMRDGFGGRGSGKFPVSIALVGMRDLRDYLVHSKDGIPINPGSPFNIKQDSASLSNFNQKDIQNLLGQHTAETGQVFTRAALDRIWHYSSGQPWLVNALCDRATQRIVHFESRETITEEHIDIAKEALIESRATHIDSLAERLRQDNVRKVIQPMITGVTDDPVGRNDRDVELCMDLGLITWDGGLKVSNAIYREVIARHLSQKYQDNVPLPEFPWKNDDGSLKMDELMREFQRFWAWHSETWESKADYTEAFPHLLLMAFMQRIVNGGGSIEREYAAGRGRVDLCVHFGGRRNIIEIKIVNAKRGRQATLEQGLIQINRYADQTQADTCHLVLFDRRPEYREKPWEERLGWEERTIAASTDQTAGRPVTVLWC